MRQSDEESKWTPAMIQVIEDAFAEGFGYEEVADLLNLSVATLKKYAGSNLEFRQAIKRGEDRAAMVKLDTKRRSRLEKQATWFIPTVEDLLDIESKMRLGWSEIKIAESLDLPLSVWNLAKKKYPEMVEALKRGEAGSQGKLFTATVNAWRPTEADLRTITELAADGFAPQAISVKLGLGASTLENHMPHIPELQEAYENGLRHCEAVVTNALMGLVKKGNVGAIIYWLKSRNKRYWSDSAPPVNVFRENPGVPNANGISFEIPKQRTVESFEKRAEQFRKAREKQQADNE